VTGDPDSALADACDLAAHPHGRRRAARRRWRADGAAAVVDFLFLRIGQLRFDDLGSVLMPRGRP
jgi:hypothetical protein